MFRYVNGGYKGGAPDSYIDYVLAKEFGWTPNQIDQMDNKRLNEILYILKLEKENELKTYKQNGKQRGITTNNFR